MTPRPVAALFCLAMGAALAPGAAFAQEAPGEVFPETPAAAAPVSELDTLSQGVVDPFPAMEENAVRRPMAAKVRALNKITARYTDIEIAIGEPARFGALEIVARWCDKRPPDEYPETTAFLQIYDRDMARARTTGSAHGAASVAPPATVPLGAQPASAETAGPPVAPGAEQKPPPDPARIFSGWMFASTPGLNPLEHPVYDVWVIDCRTDTVASEGPAL